MAWGIAITVVTLIGMLALMIESARSEENQEWVVYHPASEDPATETEETRKAA